MVALMVMETYQIRINTKYYLKYFFRWDQVIMIFNLLLVFTLNLTLVYVQIPWMLVRVTAAELATKAKMRCFVRRK